MMMRCGNKKTVMKCCDVQECGNIAAKKRAANPGKIVRSHFCPAWQCVKAFGSALFYHLKETRARLELRVVWFRFLADS